MTATLDVLSRALLLSFIICCVVSGMLQILAWARHSRKGAEASFRAMLDPNAYFDDIGVRQIHLARRLLIVGATAYVMYVFLLIIIG